MRESLSPKLRRDVYALFTDDVFHDLESGRQADAVAKQDSARDSGRLEQRDDSISSTSGQRGRVGRGRHTGRIQALLPIFTPGFRQPKTPNGRPTDAVRGPPCADAIDPAIDQSAGDIAAPPLPAAGIEGADAGDALPAWGLAASAGEKAKAEEILTAVRTLKRLEAEGRPPSPDERAMLTRFGGFGTVALFLFPDPVTGRYKTPAGQRLGQELLSLLSTEEYESAKRTVFNAFYTSKAVVCAMHEALRYLGVPSDATVLEPGCGSGNFLHLAPAGMRFIGVEMDLVSGRLARALHPDHDIRIENFRDTQLSSGSVDAVIGNVPFADVRLAYGGQRFSLHDFFFAKSLDVLRPGGILALISSHFTLDKQNAVIREYLGSRADFLGAIRLPSDAFRREGTRVVADILFLRRRSPGEAAQHADPAWLETAPHLIDGAEISINSYFLRHPEMMLGTFSRRDRLYGGQDGYSVSGTGDLAAQLRAAIEQLPRAAALATSRADRDEASLLAPPAAQSDIVEGRFLVGNDRRIYQWTNGRSEPVIYGGTLLRADSGQVGRRLALLIQLRDDARRVLQSQNEGWPPAERKEARRELNRSYDRFARIYGPINKTTLHPAAGGTVIRRMPNLVKFREDPDAMLVLALEEYDEASGAATKAPIMHRDVVVRHPPIESVGSAEEGLLVSLDRRGIVDIPYIAQLYGAAESRIIEQLGELLYRDPETGTWQTADEYLSGNVRSKLAAAEKAGPLYARNAEALREVQPEDVLPGEIDAHLGAPWIPVGDVQAFAASLFGVPNTSIRVAHLEQEAAWSLDAAYDAAASLAATSDFGTARASGITLLEQALNQRSPVIYDTVDRDGREVRIVNQAETLAARDKQQRIKEAFRSWIFADPDRAERLVRLYNDTYNNLRPRLFDGSHLAFPGMNQAITLFPHQKAAVWRGMTAGNTLLAHAVGAGKTYTMAATGMKLRQAGLIRKPMYVVPNHMLEQFAREFLQLYPNAHLLIATKEDLARERRKHLTAKVASGDWDGVIVTHSSFERIGLSAAYQTAFLREQIRAYEELLCAHERGDDGRSHRNLLKAIEKQKARREERLRELLAEDKKDDGLVFDELGVDHLFIDESHIFKNLETATKMERVAGIQTEGSERAFDLFMKSRYLDGLRRGRGVTFATGTPVSNTMVELYTIQRFLDLEGLHSRGIEHFDAWAATFGEVVDAMEISPDGASLRPRSRFARFTNLPELQQMFRSFADVQTAEMLDLPRPRLEGGKAAVIACPMSEEQQALQRGLVARYERLRSERIDPREDNALAITTDGRKLALDARLLSASAIDFADAKVNALAENVASIWRRTAASRGTQLIFCDLGVHPTPWGYCVYEEVIEKLTALGIPRGEIAAVGDADSDAKKQSLFERVRTGAIRVLIGSTQKMGVGTNVQKRLAALHHLDAPWKPAEVEQREGRILRQGNMNEEVAIYRYVTEGSFDAYMWQALETKARFIAQVMGGDGIARRADDIGGQELSYAEVKAIASGNPAVLTLAHADAEIKRLAILRRCHADEQFTARRSLRDLPETIAKLSRNLADFTADRETATSHADDPIIIGEVACDRERAIALLGRRLDTLPPTVAEIRQFTLGQVQGLRFGIVLHPHGAPKVSLEGAAQRHASLSRDAHGPRAVLNAIDRLVAGYSTRIDELRQELAVTEANLQGYQLRHGAPFAHDGYLAELSAVRDQLRMALARTASDPATAQAMTAADIAERIRSLLATHTVEPASRERQSLRTATAERPVVERILERIGRESRAVIGHPAGETPPSAPAA